jgi:hypothetical protein
MARVRLNSAVITDWPTFHAECQRALGFPEFYGANLVAWIDCMSYLREEVAAGMAGVALSADEILALEIPDAESLRRRVPEIVEALWDCVAFVNRRYTDGGELAALSLVPLDGQPSRPAA